MTNNPHVHPGALVHFTVATSVPTSDDFGLVLARGAEIELTAQVIAAGLDRNGASWLDLLGRDDEQLERWGEIRFRPGPWPAGESALVHGSTDWADTREQARKAAWSIEDPEQRRAAREAVHAEFGVPPSTVKTLSETRR